MDAGSTHTPVSGNRLIRRLTWATAAALLLVVLALAYLAASAQDRRVDVDGPQLTALAVIEGPGEGAHPTFDRPLGVAVADDGTIYVADSGNDRICAFSRKGRFLREWGRFGLTKPLPGTRKTWQPGLLNYPVGIDVGDDGLVYVADFHNDQISVFDPEGVFVRAFPDPGLVTGRGGSGADGHGIAVTDVSARDGYVAATDTYQIFIFTTGGTFVRQFGKPGSGLTDLDHPNGVDFAGDSIVVSDSNHRRIASFDTQGRPKWSVGSADDSQDSTGGVSFGLPRGVSVLDDGRILVADSVNQSLRLLDASGRQLAELGIRGTERGQFNFPTDVASYGDVIVVADKENNRVQVLQLAGEGN